MYCTFCTRVMLYQPLLIQPTGRQSSTFPRSLYIRHTLIVLNIIVHRQFHPSAVTNDCHYGPLMFTLCLNISQRTRQWPPYAKSSHATTNGHDQQLFFALLVTAGADADAIRDIKLFLSKCKTIINTNRH